MMSGCWSMKFLCLGPLDTLVACKFKGEALSSNDHSSDIDKYVSINSFSCEIEIFVSLYVKVRHQLQFDLIYKVLLEKWMVNKIL